MKWRIKKPFHTTYSLSKLVNAVAGGRPGGGGGCSDIFFCVLRRSGFCPAKMPSPGKGFLKPAAEERPGCSRQYMKTASTTTKNKSPRTKNHHVSAPNKRMGDPVVPTCCCCCIAEVAYGIEDPEVLLKSDEEREGDTLSNAGELVAVTQPVTNRLGGSAFIPDAV